MAAPNSSTSNQVFSVVDREFCINSTTKFAVRKQPPVLSTGDRWIIQDRGENTRQGEKFILKQLALTEPGLEGLEELALTEPGLEGLDGKLILIVKPEGKKQWNVFRTMESVLQPGKKKSKTPDPLFTVKTSGDYSEITVPRTDYKIEGSLAERITISHISGGVRGVAAVVELKYKVEDIQIDSVQNNQVEDNQIYSVCDVDVEPGYDQAFIFGLVAVFEQIRKRLDKK